MTPHDRVKRYAQLAAAVTILVWGTLCFFLIVSPRGSKLKQVESTLDQTSKQLSGMRKEIENASIAGTPAPGESRYEKFGILATDEEQLFLSDLIGFCKETGNTLNVVRRSDVARSAAPRESADKKKQEAEAAAQGAAPRPVIMKVPHTVSFTGTFLSSFYLLRKLEAYKRLLTVERVEIAADTRDGYPKVNGSIIIDLYLVKNPGQPTDEGAEGETAAPAGAEVAARNAPSTDEGGGQG
jgi:hypothetical protein